METIIITRHGDYDPNTGSLDDDGIAGVNKLADAIKTYVTRPVAIIASPILRATETAELIASLLPGVVEVIECDALADGAEVSGTDCNELIDAAVANAGEEIATVVLVTHDQVAHNYVNHYLYRAFGVEHPRHFQIGYAEAVVVSARDGEIRVIARGSRTISPG